MSKKGSPEDYYVGTGEEAPARNPQEGEPHECKPLYRIRRSQETHQLLQQSGHGEILREGRVTAERSALRAWATGEPRGWHGAMEATLFSAWIFDTLQPYADKLDMAHPARIQAITAAKKKNDRIDARTIADLLRCNLLPCCPVASPEIRELRRLLRYRNLVVRESVRMQNKMAGLLMECGTVFEKERLHGKKYFSRLLNELEEVPGSVKDLLRLSRGAFEMFQAVQKQLIQRLLAHPELRSRVERLATIDGIGEITALTWALEIGDPWRFSSSAKAMSYCGLTSALRSSADREQRGPLSKQRNQWLQTALIEAAKLAPRWNPQLAMLHARELERGHRNRATLAVARKLCAYLLAVDKSGQPFQVRSALPPPATACTLAATS